MSYPSLIRLGGLAAMVGGVVYAGVGLTEARLARGRGGSRLGDTES